VSSNKQGIGSGISSDGDVTLTDSTVSDNEGTGISSDGDVTLTNSTVSDNEGTGISSNSNVALTNSTVSNNEARSSPGGGIRASLAVTLINSIVSGNKASSGGGISGRRVTLTNSTISGNEARFGGGGIYSSNNTTLTNSTISGNESRFGGGGISISGIRNNQITNSIVADNQDTSGAAPDISADLSTSTVEFSLIENTAGITAGAPTNGVNGNIVGVDPQLLPLGNYGGPTQTHALAPSSPAFNAGSNTSAATLTNDQRGQPRISGIVDMGAFELQSNLTLTNGDGQNTTVNTLFSTNLQVTLTDEFSNRVSGQSITFTPAVTGASGIFDSGNIATTDANGLASNSLTANTVAGNHTVTVSLGNLSVDFNLANNPDNPASLSITGGNNQNTTVNTAFSDALQVIVKDQFNNLVPNATITFNAPTTGASITSSNSSVTTDNAGVATLSVAANTVSGAYTVQAGVNSAKEIFNLTNNPDVTTQLQVTGFPSPATVGVEKSFTVTAQDQFGNTTPNYAETVTFSSSDSLAELPSSSTLTSGTGDFSAILKTTGTQSITATDNSITGSQNNITVNTTPPPTTNPGNPTTNPDNPTTNSDNPTTNPNNPTTNPTTDVPNQDLTQQDEVTPLSNLGANNGLCELPEVSIVDSTRETPQQEEQTLIDKDCQPESGAIFSHPNQQPLVK
ncbi:MAG: choice-of-anchor Q domain-containing protein, partial [Spirulinaceae cyanobacterium]